MDLTNHIEVYRKFRNLYPIHIGGSFALILMGFDLGRDVKDLDIIIPTAIDDRAELEYKLLDEINQIGYNFNPTNHFSTSDFDRSYRLEKYRVILSLDLKYSPDNPPYKDVIYKEQTFRVCTLDNIIYFKRKYASSIRGVTWKKHFSDLEKLQTQGVNVGDLSTLRPNIVPIEEQIIWETYTSGIDPFGDSELTF